MEYGKNVAVIIYEHINNTELSKLIEGLTNLEGFEFAMTIHHVITRNIRNADIPRSLASMCMPKSTQKLANLSASLYL